MNATAQPVPPVSNPATFFASRVLPDAIAEALIEAREKCGVQKRTDEEGHAYFDAVDVVPEVGKVFRDVGLSLFAPNFQIRSVGTWLVLQRAGCLRHDKGSQFPITAEWLIDLGGLPPGPAMNAALTQSTSGLYRVCMDLVKDETKTKRDPALTERPTSGKRSTARQIGAWGRANGLAVPEDVSERQEKEAREELARVEAEKRADADPRFAGEAPLPDPPGLMEDEPTIPPAPAEEFDRLPLSKAVGGQWVVYEAETVTVSRAGGDVSILLPSPGSVAAKAGAEPREVVVVDAAKQNAEVDAYLAAKFQPGSGNSDTSSEGPCKRAPESTPPSSSSDGDSHSVPSAGGEAPVPPDSPPAPGPSDELVQPSPEVVALVGQKASQVLSKRSAEGRASLWTSAKTTKARKAFGCQVCQPANEDGDHAGVGVLPGGGIVPLAIQRGDTYRDGGGAGRCCLRCWERLESEAAGSGKVPA